MEYGVDYRTKSTVTVNMTTNKNGPHRPMPWTDLALAQLPNWHQARPRAKQNYLSKIFWDFHNLNLLSLDMNYW